MKESAVIEDVRAGSPAFKSGLLKGDIVLSINGNPIRDEVDYAFYGSEPELLMEIERANKTHTVSLRLKESENSGITLRQFKIKTCKNKCIFCFVSQLPQGLRKTLYVRDEDYRMSFLHGNYITITNLTDEDKQRIVTQRLSPLYISVHTTNRALREGMLGRAGAHDIMKELRFLKENRIKVHTQIVLCPGLNDGIELKKTISELYTLYPYVCSIAVVPVGLTSHRKIKLRPVKKEDAEKVLSVIEIFQKRFKKKHGDPIVYAGDELYIKAETSFHTLQDYGDLPQLENGVGLVPLFTFLAKAIKPQKPLHKKYLTLTGISFYPYLKRFLERLSKTGINITAIPIENSFFGSSITVTGLITGRDVIRELKDKTSQYDLLLIPDVVLRNGKDVFLDDLTPKDIGEILGIKIRVIESTPDGVINGVMREE